MVSRSSASAERERADWIAKEMWITKKLRTCKHFTGIGDDACKAGVNYRKLVGGDDFGWALGIPCVGFASSKRAVVECDLRECPTLDEATAYVDEAQAYIADVVRRLDQGWAAVHDFVEDTGE